MDGLGYDAVNWDCENGPVPSHSLPSIYESSARVDSGLLLLQMNFVWEPYGAGTEPTPQLYQRTRIYLVITRQQRKNGHEWR